jgi:ABC-2 type transport system ATP-binding protein
MVSALSRAGVRPSVAEDGAIVVAGVPSAQIGELAAQASLTLHELTPQRASLEDAFMELTSDAVEYRSHNGDGDHRDQASVSRSERAPVVVH